MYVYVCIYVYVYIYVHMFVYIYIHIYIYIYIYTYIHTCMHIYTYIYLYTSTQSARHGVAVTDGDRRDNGRERLSVREVARCLRLRVSVVCSVCAVCACAVCFMRVQCLLLPVMRCACHQHVAFVIEREHGGCCSQSSRLCVL